MHAVQSAAGLSAPARLAGRGGDASPSVHAPRGIVAPRGVPARTGAAARLSRQGRRSTSRLLVRAQASNQQPQVAAAASAPAAAEVHPPSAEFRKTANVPSREAYEAMYKKSIEDPSGFWGDIARQFHWQTPFDAKNVVNYNFDTHKGPIHIDWFKGGKTNISYNCLDKHIAEGRGDKVAMYWEGNDVGEEATYTYNQLYELVCQITNYLRSIGVKKGDRVVAYLPMVVELPAVMLACARLGAVHSVVFGGFSAEALHQRIDDSRPKCVFTMSAVKRGAKPIALKSIVDDALKLAKRDGIEVKHVVCIDNPHGAPRDKVPWFPERDAWWHDAVPFQAKHADPEWVDAEDPLFMLYTSGSTGKPKGVVHTTGGYMVGAATTFKYAFDYKPDDVYFSTADCGWITGHTYLAYGPLLNCATQVVFEGVPTYPDAGRCWEIVDKYKVSIFYTAPTLIRSLQRLGDEWVTKHSRSTLRVLGSVGEPINPEAWRWYHNVVGDGRCPISDTWWQTETGAHMITPIPGAFDLKPGSASLPFFGVQPVLVDDKGHELHGEAEGILCIKAPWPSAMRTIYHDHARFETTYFKPYKGLYFTSDGARRDKDGYYWITGRVDDVVNVSGHRIGTAEVEGALVLHESCVEAAVVGVEHPIKGQGIYAYVTLKLGFEPSDVLKKELVSVVRAQIGAFAAPDAIHWAPGLPKTRSGKIMRRILRKIANNELEGLGDISTLADPSVVQKLIESKGQ